MNKEGKGLTHNEKETSQAAGRLQDVMQVFFLFWQLEATDSQYIYISDSEWGDKNRLLHNQGEKGDSTSSQ